MPTNANFLKLLTVNKINNHFSLMLTYCIIYCNKETKMSRNRKNTFTKPKILEARVEEEDYFKFESLLKKDRKSVQELINSVVVSYISGNIKMIDGKITIQENTKDVSEVG